MLFSAPIDHFVAGTSGRNLKFWLIVLVDSQNVLRLLLLFLALDGSYLTPELYYKFDPYLYGRVFVTGFANKHFALSHSSVFLFFIYVNYICFHKIDPTFDKLIRDMQTLKQFSDLMSTERNAVQDIGVVRKQIRQITSRKLEFCPDLKRSDKLGCYRRIRKQNRTIYKWFFWQDPTTIILGLISLINFLRKSAFFEGVHLWVRQVTLYFSYQNINIQLINLLFLYSCSYTFWMKLFGRRSASLQNALQKLKFHDSGPQLWTLEKTLCRNVECFNRTIKDAKCINENLISKIYFWGLLTIMDLHAQNFALLMFRGRSLDMFPYVGQVILLASSWVITLQVTLCFTIVCQRFYGDYKLFYHSVFYFRSKEKLLFKLKVLTFYEFMAGKRKFAFTIGKIARCTKIGIYIFVFQYSSLLIFYMKIQIALNNLRRPKV